MDLTKEFHCVPWKVMQWAMKVIDIPELISTLAKAIYDNVKSRGKVNCECKNLC